MKYLLIIFLNPLLVCAQRQMNLEFSMLSKSVANLETERVYPEKKNEPKETLSFGYGAQFSINSKKFPSLFYTVGIDRLHRRMSFLLSSDKNIEEYQQFNFKYNFTSTFLNWGLYKEIPVFKNFSVRLGVKTVFKFYSDRDFYTHRPFKPFTSEDGDLEYDVLISFKNSFGIGFSSQLDFLYAFKNNSKILAGVSILPQENIHYEINTQGRAFIWNNNILLFQKSGYGININQITRSVQFNVTYIYPLNQPK